MKNKVVYSFVPWYRDLTLYCHQLANLTNWSRMGNEQDAVYIKIRRLFINVEKVVKIWVNVPLITWQRVVFK